MRRLLLSVLVAFLILCPILILVHRVLNDDLSCSDLYCRVSPKKPKAEEITISRGAFINMTWHNVKFQLGLASYRMGITPLSQLSLEEYTRMLSPEPKVQSPYTYTLHKERHLPNFANWTEKLAVQGTRWNSDAQTDALLSLLESSLHVTTGRTRRIPLQHLGACVTPKSAEDKLRCIDAQGLIESIIHLDRFPLKNFQNPSLGAVEVIQPSEYALKQYVSKGPVFAVIHATNSFRHYKSGVFFDPACNQDTRNLPVLIVGYGIDEQCGDYWLIRTNFGPKWGENGFGRIARNRDNHCGIANHALVLASPLKDYYAEQERLEEETRKSLENQRKIEAKLNASRKLREEIRLAEEALEKVKLSLTKMEFDEF